MLYVGGIAKLESAEIASKNISMENKIDFKTQQTLESANLLASGSVPQTELEHSINTMTEYQLKNYVHGLFDSSEFPSLDVLRELSSDKKNQYMQAFETEYKMLKTKFAYHVGLEHAKDHLTSILAGISFEDLSTSKALRQLAYKAISPVLGMSAHNVRHFSHKLKYQNTKDRSNHLALIKKAIDTFGLKGSIPQYTKDDSYLLSQTEILAETGLAIIAYSVSHKQYEAFKSMKEVVEITRKLLNLLGSKQLDMRFDLTAREYMSNGLLAHIKYIGESDSIDIATMQALGGPNLKTLDIKAYNATAVKTQSDLLKFVQGSLPKNKFDYMNSLYRYVRANRHAIKQKFLESKELVSVTEDGIDQSAFIAKVNEDLKSRYQEAAERQLLVGAQDFAKDWVFTVNDDNVDQLYMHCMFGQQIIGVIKEGGLLTEEQLENMKKAIQELDENSLVRKLGNNLLAIYTSDRADSDKERDFGTFAHVHLQSLSTFIAEQEYLVAGHLLAKDKKMLALIDKVDSENKDAMLKWQNSVNYVSDVLNILTDLTPDWKNVRPDVKAGIFHANNLWMGAKKQYESSLAEENNSEADNQSGHIDIQSVEKKVK